MDKLLLKRPETHCNCSFWKLVSLIVFQKSFLLLWTLSLLIGSFVTLVLTVRAERRPPPPQRKKIAKSINYVKDLFVCLYLLQRCLKILRIHLKRSLLLLTSVFPWLRKVCSINKVVPPFKSIFECHNFDESYEAVFSWSSTRPGIFTSSLVLIYTTVFARLTS